MVSLVLSGLALLGVLVVAGLVLGDGSIDEDTGSSSTLTGQLDAAASRSPLSGDDLSHAVRGVLEQDGSEVERLSCPSTPAVRQGVVTVCHGEIDEDDWAVIVFFETPEGAFTLSLV